MFKPPPYTALSTDAALGNVETDSSQTMHYAGADIADCFCRLGVPDSMEQFCSKPEIEGLMVIEIANQFRLPSNARFCFLFEGTSNGLVVVVVYRSARSQVQHLLDYS